MDAIRRVTLMTIWTLPILGWGVGGVPAAGDVGLNDVSLDKPLVLDENTDYRLRNVTVAGVRDCAALTLVGRIQSVSIEQSSFGRVRAGTDGRAVGVECAGAMVGRLLAIDTTFFDAENELISLKDGSFGKVTFERCRFTTSSSFLKEIYSNNPWRSWPPVAEFYNIERLELLDNEYSNTTVVIHPSVKQVILRGDMPGLQVRDRQATQLFHLLPGETAEHIAPPAGGALATAEIEPGSSS